MTSLFVAKAVGLIAVYFSGLVLGTVLHELGHAFMALLATRQQVGVEIGRNARARARLGRLRVLFGAKGLRYGFTRYDRSAVSRGRQTLVALAGPLASLAGCVAFAWLAFASSPESWLWVLWLGLSIANFRILVVSLWPIAYRPDGPEGEVWLSDALDLWRLWRG